MAKANLRMARRRVGMQREGSERANSNGTLLPSGKGLSRPFWTVLRLSLANNERCGPLGMYVWFATASFWILSNAKKNQHAIWPRK
jgi:hypothetical protein